MRGSIDCLKYFSRLSSIKLFLGVLVLVTLFFTSGCKEKDPFRELIEGEDFGIGVTLDSYFPDVPKFISKTLGEYIAEHQVSPDARYYQFMDKYRNYSFIIADIDQTGSVDAIIITVAEGGNPTAIARRFGVDFPKVRTKVGITIGSTVEEVAASYFGGNEEFKGLGWINSSSGNLRFDATQDVVTSMFLANRKARDYPLTTLIGRNMPEVW